MKNANLLIVLVIVVIALVGIVIFTNKPAPEYAGEPQTNLQVSASDTDEAINQDLESIDLSDIDEEFKAIDQDLQSL